MFLHLLAAVRSTETWTSGNLIAIGIVISFVAAWLYRVRVRRRK